MVDGIQPTLEFETREFGEISEQVQSILNGGYISRELRREFLEAGTDLFERSLKMKGSPSFFFYDSPLEHHTGMGPLPNMLDELVLYYTQRGRADFILITAGDEESLKITVNAPNVHRITMGISPILSLNDLKEQLSSFAAKEACVVIPALPVVSTFQFPWKELNEHAQSLGFATILDCRGALGRISMEEVRNNPSVILCDTPVVVSGQQSVCHCVATSHEDLQKYLLPNHLLRLNEATTHSDSSYAQREGLNLSRATLSTICELAKKDYLKRSQTVAEQDTDRASELSLYLQRSLRVPEFKLLSDLTERTDQVTLYSPYQPLQRCGRYGKLAFVKYLRTELRGISVNMIDGTILLSVVAPHYGLLFADFEPSHVKAVIDKWVYNRVVRRAVAEKLLGYKCIEQAREILTNLRERAFY